MKVLLAGASGLIGTALVPALRAAGHEVRRLVRRPPEGTDGVAWDPGRLQIDPRAFADIDAVVNLSGENIGAGRWSASRRERIFHSRVDATRTLVMAIAALARKPSIFISASAAGYYGDRGDELLTERSEIGHGFLPEVCLAWETHAEGAARVGVRTARLRLGVVLAEEGGAIGRMAPLFKLGLGGRLGHGRQWMPWISLDDAVRAILHILTHPHCEGAYNLTAPEPVTNADFTRALAGVLHRPAVLPAPAWALRLALGRMADEALLASTRALPERLTREGFKFRHPEVRLALEF
ncbi:MAG: TIGR01777 family oxidoreductase [Opitutus sp.]